MKEIDEKINNLIKVLDKNENIIKIKKLNKIIDEDKELKKLLEEYKYSNSDTVKRNILENNNYKDYKETETEINFLIMYLNKKLKEISDRKGCI